MFTPIQKLFSNDLLLAIILSSAIIAFIKVRDVITCVIYIFIWPAPFLQNPLFAHIRHSLRVQSSSYLEKISKFFFFGCNWLFSSNVSDLHVLLAFGRTNSASQAVILRMSIFEPLCVLYLISFTLGIGDTYQYQNFEEFGSFYITLY